MSATDAKTPRGPTISIIGAGVGGIMMAISLKEKLGFLDFVVYERANEIGGTWRANTYPGCSSDVAIHVYSYSNDLNPDWSHTHGLQPEIHAYWLKVVEKYGIRAHIVFNTAVVSAEWLTSEQSYRIVCENVLTGEKSTSSSRVLIPAVGFVDIPKYPDIPGLHLFKGDMFHSARWKGGLEGKRVAVIGNGASAIQFIPKIVENDSVDVTQFCRTPTWLMPPIRAPIPAWTKWAFRYIPFAARSFRNFMYFRTELKYYNVWINQTMRKLIIKFASNYIRRAAPAEYRDQLVPNYEMGCKRIVFDTGYLTALHQQNLRIVWEGIEEVVPTGIKTVTGNMLPFDVIILATGFETDKFPFPVVGSKSRTLQEYYTSHGGPTAYLGTTIPEFPNFFMLSGPNTGTGYMSVVFFEEVQINYILSQLRVLLSPSALALSLNVKESATRQYNEKIHSRLSRSVYVDCRSWYRTDGNGKISTIFPGPSILFWWWARTIQWKDYFLQDASGNNIEATEFVKETGRKDVMGWKRGLALTVGIAALYSIVTYVLPA